MDINDEKRRRSRSMEVDLTGEKLITATEIARLPKVLLHEHLDGGLRPQTVIDLAADAGYEGLPSTDPVKLSDWFHRGAQRGNLPEYLEGFAHTIAVMQTNEAIERVAFEFVEDMHHDGVVYAEVRFAPVFHTGGGMNQEAVVLAAIRGLRRAERSFGVRWGLIICGMRNRKDTLEAAELAINFRDQGVVGFDLAGEEDGYPPKQHLPAFQTVVHAQRLARRTSDSGILLRGPWSPNEAIRAPDGGESRAHWIPHTGWPPHTHLENRDPWRPRPVGF